MKILNSIYKTFFKDWHKRNQNGLGLPAVLGAIAVIMAIGAAATVQSGRDLNSLSLFRLAANRDFVQNWSTDFLKDPHIVRSLLATGSDYYAQACWTGNVPGGCYHGRAAPIVLRMPGINTLPTSRLSFDVDGSICDSSVRSCGYSARFVFTGYCPNNEPTCRSAASGNLDVVLTPVQRSRTAPLAVYGKVIRLTAATGNGMAYPEMNQPIDKAWRQFTGYYPGFYFEPTNPYWSNVQVMDQTNPDQINLMNCATGRVDGRNCRAGGFWMSSARPGTIGGYPFGNDPVKFGFAPTGPYSWRCLGNPGDPVCAYQVFVWVTITCPGNAGQCEFAHHIDFDEYLVNGYDVNAHRPAPPLPNFTTPVANELDTPHQIGRRSFTYYVPDPYRTLDVTVRTFRGSAGFQNCGRLGMPGRAYQDLSCNTEGDRVYRVSITARWDSCNRIDLMLYSTGHARNCSNMVVDTRDPGTNWRNIQITARSPYNLQLGFEDQCARRADWDYNDYYFYLDFPVGLKFYVPGNGGGNLFNNCN